MKSFCRISITVAILATGLTSVGTGTAFAKDAYVGKTYAEASAKLSDNGYSAVISSVVGDQLATDDCIVLSSRKASYAETDNFDHGKNYLLALNCSAPLAHGGQPGNSLASPQGRKEKAIEERAARYNAKPETCTKNLESCKKFCDSYEGRCSDDVLALF